MAQFSYRHLMNRRQQERPNPPAKRLFMRANAVCRPSQARKCSAELLAPVGNLSCLFRSLQPLPLPICVVAELHRQRAERRGTLKSESVIEGRQFAWEDLIDGNPI